VAFVSASYVYKVTLLPMAQPGGRFQKIRRRHKIRGLFRLIRIPNLLMILLCQVLVSFRLLEPDWWLNPTQTRAMVFVFLATLASAAGGYIINDYYDVKIDVLNKPKRVIVGQLVSRRKSLIAHFLLFLSAVCFGFFAGLRVAAVVFFSSSWLWLYSNKLKRLPLIGNFSIAVLTAVALYLPSKVSPPSSGTLLIFCLFAFWISLIREIVKDMEDIRGDVRHGCRTLPIVLGIPKTRSVLYIFGILFLITIFWSSFSMPPVWRYVALVLAIPLTVFYIKLTKADTQKAFSELSLWCKWIMLGGTISILLV